MPKVVSSNERFEHDPNPTTSGRMIGRFPILGGELRISTEPIGNENQEISPPEVLRFSIDHSGPKKTVEWRDGFLVYQDNFVGDPQPVYSPTPMQWKRFWEATERASVWSWQEAYLEPILDGTSWRLEMEHACRRIESEGSNGYPGSEGSRYGEASEFARFLRALSGLVGGREIS